MHHFSDSNFTKPSRLQSILGSIDCSFEAKFDTLIGHLVILEWILITNLTHYVYDRPRIDKNIDYGFDIPSQIQIQPFSVQDFRLHHPQRSTQLHSSPLLPIID